MALDDLLISTGVDHLIKLIKERQRMEIGAIAEELKLPLRTVEDWSHVLEEEGLVTIEYKLTKIYLVWHAPTPEVVAEKAEKLERKAVGVRTDITTLVERVGKGGRDVEQMQRELGQMESASAMSPAEVAKMKDELGSLEKKYGAAISDTGGKLLRLKKRLDALAPEIGEGEDKARKGGAIELERELAVVKKLEETVQSQLADVEAFYGAFETRTEEFRKRVEENRGSSEAESIKGELAEVRALRNELAGAIEAVADEQKTLTGKLSLIEKRFADLAEQEGGSVGAAKKKLLELRKMEDDAKRQKEAVVSQLQDALSLAKKQTARLAETLESAQQTEGRMQEIKNDYVDVSEEISHANEELAAKQKEVSQKISGQLAALELAKTGAAGKISKEEIQKVSFLLRELRREHQMLEGKVKMLAKEAEILNLSAQPGAGASAGGREMPSSLVERVQLSEKEEGEFEKKREELRHLIRKMWEESKPGRGS